MARRVLLDVDTGIDDALALLYAVAHPDLELLGVSCVAGNSPLPQVVNNTLRVLDVAGAAGVPVGVGGSSPLLERARREDQPHGPDGLGGIALPPPSRKASIKAIDLLRNVITGSADPVTLVALAPQTNLALLLSEHPDVKDRLAGIVFVGGWADPQHQDRPEFNVSQDPEAAAAVIASGVPVTMYAMEVFTQLAAGLELAERFRDHKHAAVRLAGELLTRRGVRDPNHRTLIGDAGALIYLTDPALFTVRPLPVAAEIRVVLNVNPEAAAETFAAAIARYR